MTEYIERKIAIEAFENGEADVIEDHGDGCDFGFGIKNVKDTLNAIPAADVAPVVHGKWIFKSRWHDSIDENLCSECGQLMTTAAEKQMDYCPNCGARMDGRYRNA